MPIYEFKCSKCDEFFEVLIVRSDDESEVACPKCGHAEFERVMSTTNYAMGAAATAAPAGSGTSSQTRSCSGGSCTTWDLPGHTR
jgi:putative FmdB family regulatory protein